jgi:two-component system, OmpR family, sensor histidine kinase CreC
VKTVKIRTAIFGVYVAASALGFAVLVALVLHDVRLRYVESMRRTLGDTAAFLAAFVAPEAASNPAWARKLAMLPSNAALLRVFACDAAGRVVFDSAHSEGVGQTYGWLTGAGGPAFSELEGEFRVATPVRTDGNLVGWVGVARPLSTVANEVNRARWQLAWSFGGVAAVMVAAGWWIASKLTHSIERLTDYAVAVRDGRAVVPPESRAQEVAALARAFEEMRIALEGKAYVERYTQALAHEFKAPLSSIRGAAELLTENPPEPDRARFIANLRAESARLQLIVDRLLELAALESRRANVGTESVDLAKVVRAAHASFLTAAESRQITLTLTIDATPQVRGEEFLLSQSIGNLVQNALEFSPAGGVVEVALQVDGSQALVCVDDTGPGVPDYALEKIFDRFYSLPRPDTGRKSSGLGLSIVREIARLHGGEISLANRPEGGARAVLSLPIA